MNYRYFMIKVFFLAAMISCKKGPEKKVSITKPNIVFIFTDDQTYSSVHALGNKEIITPSLDKLVNLGTTFTNAYNMGSWSGAVCTASRTMLNSGRSVWRANTFRKKWGKDNVEDQNAAKLLEDQSWSKLLEAHGYETYMTGKWHVDLPAEKLFQHVKHVRPGMPKDAWDHYKMVSKFDSLSKIKNANANEIMPNGYNRPLSENDSSWIAYDKNKGGFWEGGKHWSEVLKDDAISFIDSAKGSAKPFFMYLAFNAPHDPRQAPKSYLEKYPLDKISVPESYLAEYPFKDDIANGQNLRDEALAPFPRTEYAIKKHTQEYYASISHLDDQIGAIVKALEDSGQMENTYIFLTSDHGLAMGRHGLLGKQSLFDHSIRPPMIIIGPDLRKNHKIHEDVYLQDVMATSLDLAGVERPDYVEFNSFLDLARGETNKSHYSEIYGAYLEVQRMIRKDGYKLLVFPKANKVLLFDLKTDPEEMNDISSDPKNKDLLDQLFKDLIRLQKEMDDPLDLSQIYDQVLG